MRNKRLIVLIEGAIMLALSYVLGLFHFGGAWAFGGSISLEMLPLIAFSFRRGIKAGMFTGMVYGFLDLIIDPAVIHPVQLILDYPLPFMLLGFAGVFTLRSDMGKGKRTFLIIAGAIFGTALRFVSHLLSGVIFFASYAGDQNVWIYSIVYNISYLLPSLIAVLIVLIAFDNLTKLLTRKG